MKYNPYSHFYLYAKGWYDRSNIELDLRMILANYCGLEWRYLNKRDILAVLLPLVYSEIKHYGSPEYMFSVFSCRVEEEGILKACMYALNATLTRADWKLPLCAPDPEVLPLSENITEEDLEIFK